VEVSRLKLSIALFEEPRMPFRRRGQNLLENLDPVRYLALALAAPAPEEVVGVRVGLAGTLRSSSATSCGSRQYTESLLSPSPSSDKERENRHPQFWKETPGCTLKRTTRRKLEAPQPLCPSHVLLKANCWVILFSYSRTKR
jgi:hypothetical protein